MAEPAARTTGIDPSHERRLHEVIAAYLEAREAGTEPDRQAILSREADLATELASFFANQDRLAQIAGALLRDTEDPAILAYPGMWANRADHHREGRESLAAGVAVSGSAPHSPIRYFGDYELLEEIARGGMGIVYKARQVSLNRILALKLILAGQFASSEDLVRFRLEAEAAAHLDHPGIVPIFEVGQHDGHHYFSMKLIEGGNLAGRLDQFRSDPHASARLMFLVASAVHYAHQRGILHRDLKPANILLSGGRDEPLWQLNPLVTDFGLAKRVEESESAGPTSSGSILGTPCYMAPEQAEGRRAAVTTAVDIHALGVILYELLVGRPPFHADTIMETLRQVREQEPVRPRSIEPRVPRDLETIVLKCLEKRPSQRYPSVQDLAEDLDRWLTGLPIRARATSPPERLWKWARRRPAAAGLLALGAVSILALSLAARGHLAATRMKSDVVLAGKARDVETRRRLQAEFELAHREQDAYFKRLIAAEQAWKADDPDRADALLAQCPEPLRRWEWFHLRRRFHSEIQTFKGHNGFLCATAFTPEGAQVACAAEQTGFVLWRTERGGVVRRIPGHDGTSYGIAFNRSGTRMAAALAGGTVRVIDLESGETQGWLKGHEGYVVGVAFSPDDRTLATSGQDGIVRLWDVSGTSISEHAAPLGLLRGHAGPVFGVAFSADGTRLASAGQDATVRLWDLETKPRREVRVFRGHGQAVRCVAFHPQGHQLASAGADRTVRVWDAETGDELLHFGRFGNRVDGVAFSPDGLRIATASLDRSVKVWDARNGAPLTSFHGHAAAVFGVSFSPDGKRLASAGQDATVKLWDLTTTPGVRKLVPPVRVSEARKEWNPEDKVRWAGGVAFRPDGRELAVGGSAMSLAIWTLPSESGRLAPVSSTWGSVISLQYSPVGHDLAVASSDRRVTIWKSDPLLQRLTFDDRLEGFSSLAFSPDGTWLATGGGDPPEVLQQPLGKFPAAGRQPRSIQLWRAKDGEAARRWNGHLGSIHALTFVPDGTRLISAGADRTVRVWDITTGEVALRLEGHTDAVHALAVSHDGRLLASAGADRMIRVWRLTDGQLLHVLEGHTNWVQALAFHPDGSRLASAGGDGGIRIWDPSTGREVLNAHTHSRPIHGLAFSPDGLSLAASAADGEILVLESEPPRPASPTEGQSWFQGALQKKWK